MNIGVNELPLGYLSLCEAFIELFGYFHYAITLKLIAVLRFFHFLKVLYLVITIQRSRAIVGCVCPS